MSEQQAAPTLQNTAQPATQGTLQPTTGAAPAPATGAVNPPHGQPGHNCDLAVGAPLNSKPAAIQPVNAAPTNQLLTQPQVGAPAPQGASSSNVRLNPAHGQPGHNCAVEVGKPLN